jgi:hypothetical protein
VDLPVGMFPPRRSLQSDRVFTASGVAGWQDQTAIYSFPKRPLQPAPIMQGVTSFRITFY